MRGSGDSTCDDDQTERQDQPGPRAIATIRQGCETSTGSDLGSSECTGSVVCATTRPIETWPVIRRGYVQNVCLQTSRPTFVRTAGASTPITIAEAIQSGGVTLAVRTVPERTADGLGRNSSERCSRTRAADVNGAGTTGVWRRCASITLSEQSASTSQGAIPVAGGHFATSWISASSCV
jgi:hypothetical protein